MSNVSVVTGEMFKLHSLPIMQQKPIFMQYPIRDNNNKKTLLLEKVQFFPQMRESLSLTGQHV